MKLFKRRKVNNKGLSLVELVCAVAIFGVVVAAVGSVMVVSAQNYSKSTYEIDVQQEAQTTTNLIGNLIVDADTAFYDSTLVMPLLRIDESSDLAYEIEYDSTNQKLWYTEIDKITGAEAQGVLAENVVGFSTNLSDDPNNFSADRNVEVTVSIEKGTRTYEASYSTTARNGSSDSTVTDSAKILVESEIVLEPGQTYDLPVTVLGTIANKSFTAAKGNASDPITLSPNADSVRITVQNTATGTIPFVISTIEKMEDGVTPVATKDVSVKIRRINSVTGTRTITTGTEGSNGSAYLMDYGYTGTNLDKVYGKDFDIDYINPKQFAFSYSITGADAGKTWKDYIDESTIVEETGDNPNVTFSMKADLPNGAKIGVKCTALHTTGTNKSSLPYGEQSYTLYIEKPRVSLSGAINRGNDDEGAVIIMDDLLTELNNPINGYDNVVKVIEYYEATIDANGKFTRGALAFDRRSDVPEDGVEGGTRLAVRPADSNRLVPNQAYILVARVECWKDGAIVWPTPSTPESEYMGEFPISPITISYDCHSLNKGTKTNYIETSKGSYSIDISCVGLDMTKGNSSALKWDIYYNPDADNSYTDICTNITCNLENKQIDGSATMSLFFQLSGYYKFCAKLDGYEYYDYDGNLITPTADNDFSLNDGENVGVVYVRVTE